MGRKREFLKEGEYDQIVDDMNRMRKQFDRAVLRDVTAWLLMQWMRHAAREEAAQAAARAGNQEWANGVTMDARKCCDTIQDMVSRVHLAWTVRDWHEAQSFLDTMIAARDDKGRPLHALGGILSSPGGVTHGPFTSESGDGVVEHPGSPPEPPPAA